MLTKRSHLLALVALTIWPQQPLGEIIRHVQGNVLQVGSRVRVISYGPFRGLRGTILVVDAIAADLEEPFCFYLVALEGAQIKEPIWFEFHEVE